MVGLNYRSNKYQEAEMTPGTDLSIGYPYKVYLNIISEGSDRSEPSDFKLNITYVKFDPNAKEPTIPEEDKIVIQNRTVTTKIICKFIFKFLIIYFSFLIIEKDLWESGDFVIIISVAVAAICCIIILISCLIYLKIKGEKMSKVTKLTPSKENSFGSPTKNNA